MALVTRRDYVFGPIAPTVDLSAAVQKLGGLLGRLTTNWLTASHSHPLVIHGSLNVYERILPFQLQLCQAKELAPLVPPRYPSFSPPVLCSTEPCTRWIRLL